MVGGFQLGEAEALVAVEAVLVDLEAAIVLVATSTLLQDLTRDYSTRYRLENLVLPAGVPAQTVAAVQFASSRPGWRLS